MQGENKHPGKEKGEREKKRGKSAGNTFKVVSRSGEEGILKEKWQT